jgi:transposase InsO family protein
LDHSLFWTATDLELKLSAFTDYYNRYRVHAALKGHTPIESTESKRADLKLYRWRKHCRGLYQTPMAA